MSCCEIIDFSSLFGILQVPAVAYKALVRIGAIYDLEGALKSLSSEARLKERQSSIRPLVEEYFAWIKDIFRQGLVLPKSETAKGLAYSINQLAENLTFTKRLKRCYHIERKDKTC